MSWEHGFVIDRDNTLRQRVNCKDCKYFDSDKSCSKKGYYLPTIGYDIWRKCKDFMLDNNECKNLNKVNMVIKERGKEYIPEQALKKYYENR